MPLWLVCIRPPAFLFLEAFNFLKAVELSAIDSGTLAGGEVPGLRAGQVVRPEGPRSALARPNRINDTAFLAVDVLQEGAIPA